MLFGEQKPVRAIAHYDLDAFFVSVERRLNAALKGIPLIVGHEGKRGVVAACSYETRAFGVHSAMPMVQALRLCPAATVVPPNRKYYKEFSNIVTGILASEGLPLEKASIDEFYLDLSTKGDFQACYDYGSSLRKEVMETTGLPISFALSANKLISKIAIDNAKPNGQISIEPGSEEAFLSPMKIERMPMIGKETADILHKMGVFTLGQLSQSSKDTLRTFLGKNGEALINRAKGIDFSPVSDERKSKSISTETTFEEDISNTAFLRKEFVQLNERNAIQLHKSGYHAACVAIKMRFADFRTITRQLTVSPTVSKEVLQKQVIRLFNQYYADGSFLGKKVRLIGVRYSNLLEDGFQLNLFSVDQRAGKIQKIISDLQAEFGAGSIEKGSAL